MHNTKLEKKKWKGKQLYGYFKRQTMEIAREKTWTWGREWYFKRETESLLIAEQIDAIKTNYIF